VFFWFVFNRKEQMMKANIQMMLLGVSLATLIGTGCKKPPPPPPPPAPKAVVEKAPEAPPKPVIERFTAEPSTVTQGSPSTLRWTVASATDISIDEGIGTLTSSSGSRTVTPSVDTTYTLVAKGVGGTTSASVTVSVRPADRPIAPPPPVKAPTRTFNESVGQDLKDAYFDYDQFSVRDDGRSVLTQDSDALKTIMSFYSSGNVILEGHCDERGSGEYNLALGDRRAQAALDFLKGLGVTTDRLKTVSYGKDRPQCTDATEDCYQKNRRVHFSPQ
jgi:peptidoglycan-associated lipoprotein